MQIDGNIVTAFTVVNFIWIILLTAIVYQMVSHYNHLSKGVSKAGLKEILELLLTTQNNIKLKSQKIEEKLDEITEDNKSHYQRLGIVRFNPFADTGGNQSFTIAILDDKDNGIIMTSLYARSGNRWYIKEIKEGKGYELELSKEEQMAIKNAKNKTL